MRPRLSYMAMIGLSATILSNSIYLPALAQEQESAKKDSLLSLKDEKISELSVFDESFGRLERQITELAANGRLNKNAHKILKNELDNLAEKEASFCANSGTLTRWEQLELNFELDEVTKLFRKSLVDRNVASVDLLFVKNDLLKSIDEELGRGRISAKEAISLKQEYDRICNIEAVLKRSQGALSYGDKLMLCVDFDHLEAKLYEQIAYHATVLPELNQEIVFAENKIAAALKAQKISEAEAKKYRDTLNDIRYLESSSKQNKRNFDERIITLGLFLEAVSSELSEKAGETSQIKSLDERLSHIDSSIAGALRLGRLNPFEAVELKEDLDAINIQLTKSTDKDQPTNQDDLKLDIARLETSVAHKLHTPTKLWSGIPAYQAHLGIRIRDGFVAKRLSADESKTLLAESDQITDTEKRAIAGGAKLNAAKAISIAIDLQQLSGRIDKSLKDRERTLPKIDSLLNAIDERIAEALLSGNLNIGEAKEYKLWLAKAASLFDEYKSSDQDLTGREVLLVAYELQKLYLRIEEQIHKTSKDALELDVRRVRLQTLIAEGYASGRLSKAESTTYKDQLAENVKKEKDYRISGSMITAEEAIELASSLLHEFKAVDRQILERQVCISDLVSLEGRVERKIALNVSAGLLSLKEAEFFREQYNGIVSAFLKMRADDGGMSYGEKLAFAYGFQRLAASVERELQTTPLPVPNLNQRRNDLEQRIAFLIATGKLPVQEAQNIKAVLDGINSLALKAHSTGHGLSYPESLVVNMDFERLNKLIDSHVATQKTIAPDIDQLQEQLSKRIKDYKASAKLSQSEANLLNKEMERIAQCEINYRSSDESLTFMEASFLMQDLDRVKVTLDKYLVRISKPKTVKKKASH